MIKVKREKKKNHKYVFFILFGKFMRTSIECHALIKRLTQYVEATQSFTVNNIYRIFIFGFLFLMEHNITEIHANADASRKFI